MPAETPAKLQIWNVQEATILTVQCNPRELPEKLGVSYADHGVPGMSHKPLQYSYTENLKTTIDLLWFVESPEDMRKKDEDRRFILSLCYPWRGHAAPPRALLVWPGIYSLTCVVRDLDAGHKYFNRELNSTIWTCKLSFEEIRDARVWGDDVLKNGTMRNTGASLV